jgi:hypothetical protein
MAVSRFILLSALFACQLQAEQPQRLSMKAEHLMRVLENPKSDYQKRRSAAGDLGKLKEKAAVDRLLKLLPGDFDALSYDVIFALGDIGDPRALPRLGEIYANVSLGSKLSTALYQTKEKLRKLEKEAKKGK